MKKICILLLHLYLALAAQHQRPAIKKWKSPNRKPGALSKRSVGYQPELGACKDGQETCHDACGDGFEECGAGSYAAVFCYKPDDGETCCYDDEGTACDDGYYCASGGDGTVCCPDSLSLSECEDKLEVELSSISSPRSSSKKVPPKPEPTPEPEPPVRSSSSTIVTTENKRSSAPEEEGTTTITKSSTTTVIVTVPFPSSPLSLATSPSRPASPATTVFPLRSTSRLSASSFSPHVAISSSVTALPSQPSFTSATASPIDEPGTPISPEPTLSSNDTSAKASVGVPVFIPTALDDQRCDLACDEESVAEIEVYFTDTVTERVTVTLQDDSNGCERVTTLTPTFTLTATETITLGCSGPRQKDATTRGSIDIPTAVTTQRTEEQPKVMVPHSEELLGNVTGRVSGGIPEDIATQRADEKPKATVHHSVESSEDAITRGSDEVPAGIAAQPVDKKPQATAHQSDQLPAHIIPPSNPGAIENEYAVGLVFPSTIYDDYEETTPSTTSTPDDPGPIENGYAVGLVFPSTMYDDDEELKPPATLTPSIILTASADATPTFEAAETENVEAAAGTRHAPTAFACFAAFALMRVGAVM